MNKLKTLTKLTLAICIGCSAKFGDCVAAQENNPVQMAANPVASASPSATPEPAPATSMTASSDREQWFLERIKKLEQRLDELEKQPARTAAAPAITLPIAASSAPSTAQLSEDERGVLDAWRQTTFNGTFDGYYGYNFNTPYNRVNLLRAYDVSSNSFSLGQAALVIENALDLAKGKRYGFRLDLQYGQATEAAQGNANNELRPAAYRPLWQAYGTYIAPVGKDVTIDFGKWAGSLGYETNYAKDNFNYSRSYFFSFLPFYHVGLRAAYPLTDKLTATYWLVNGTQQSEDFNGFKSQALLLTYKPTKRVTLQGNYYVGREGRDVAANLNPTFPTQPTQPGLPVDRLSPVPRGRFHVLDAYATFTLTDKLTAAFEGDYVINRTQERDAPARVSGGVGYLRYQWTPKFSMTGRGEYLSDKGGLFSGTTQALKEITLTGEYKFAEGFLLRTEYRRDWSNRAFFLRSK